MRSFRHCLRGTEVALKALNKKYAALSMCYTSERKKKKKCYVSKNGKYLPTTPFGVVGRQLYHGVRGGREIFSPQSQ